MRRTTKYELFKKAGDLLMECRDNDLYNDDIIQLRLLYGEAATDLKRVTRAEMEGVVGKLETLLAEEAQDR